MKLSYLLLLIIGLTGCSGNTHTETPAETDPYIMMSDVFIGSPDVETIKPMIKAVMKRYEMPTTRENANKVGSLLLDLRKASNVGVTEMDILKHMYQHGFSGTSLSDQAAESAAYLERTK